MPYIDVAVTLACSSRRYVLAPLTVDERSARDSRRVENVRCLYEDNVKCVLKKLVLLATGVGANGEYMYVIHATNSADISS